jgi:tetratricopeptide (TPR) repeat protein
MRPRVRRPALLFLAPLALWSQAPPSPDHERAARLLASGQAAEAAAVYRRLSQAEPRNAALLLNLAIAEYKAADFRHAAASSSAALKLDPGLVPARLFLGASLLELGDYTNAIPALEQVVQADPGERNARLMLAEALLGSGRPAPALEHFRAAAQMLPSNPRLWYGLGRAAESAGDREAAAEAWTRLAALPPSLESHLHAAAVHDAQSRWRDAASEWGQALKFAPQNKSVRTALAWSLYRLRDYSAALSAIEPLIPAGGADVLFLRGASLLNLQRPDEALPWLRKSVAANRDLLPAQAALGQALLQTGKPEESIPWLRAAAPADQDGSIHFQLFRACQLTHRAQEARAALAEYQRLRSASVR